MGWELQAKNIVHIPLITCTNWITGDLTSERHVAVSKFKVRLAVREFTLGRACSSKSLILVETRAEFTWHQSFFIVTFVEVNSSGTFWSSDSYGIISLYGTGRCFMLSLLRSIATTFLVGFKLEHTWDKIRLIWMKTALKLQGQIASRTLFSHKVKMCFGVKPLSQMTQHQRAGLETQPEKRSSNTITREQILRLLIGQGALSAHPCAHSQSYPLESVSDGSHLLVVHQSLLLIAQLRSPGSSTSAKAAHASFQKGQFNLWYAGQDGQGHISTASSTISIFFWGASKARQAALFLCYNDSAWEWTSPKAKVMHLQCCFLFYFLLVLQRVPKVFLFCLGHIVSGSFSSR